ncbi:hypothetical protein ACFLUD_01745 [Chloroflexota bacterium]
MVRYIILGVFFIVVSVILFVDPLNFSQDLKAAVVPWATLALAFVAIFTIFHSDERARIGKKIDRLSSILDWTQEIIDLTHIIETIEPKEPTFLGEPLFDKHDMDHTYEIFRISDTIDKFNRLGTTGGHEQVLAWRVDKKVLYVMVRSVTQAINDLTQEEWKQLDLNETRHTLNIHEARIYGLAKPLIDDVIKRLEKT